VVFEYGPCADLESNTPGLNDVHDTISGLELGWYSIDYKINYDQGTEPKAHILMVMVLVNGVDQAGDFKSIGGMPYDMVGGTVTVECDPTTKIQLAVIHTKNTLPNIQQEKVGPIGVEGSPKHRCPAIGNYMPVGPDSFTPITARLQIRYISAQSLE
jgi:hypothetical protein